MPRDYQANRVYAWEWACESHARPQISKTAARKMINWACDLYEVPRPTFYAARTDRGNSFYHPGRHHIKIIKCHMTPFVCLHEAAHAIESHYYGIGTACHGPEWLGIYSYLLRKAKLAHAKGLAASLRAMRLKAITPRQAAPVAMKRRNKKRGGP